MECLPMEQTIKDYFRNLIEKAQGKEISDSQYQGYKQALTNYLYQLYLLDKEQRDEARNNGN